MNGIRESKPSMKGVRESGPSMKGVREVKPSMKGVREVENNLPPVQNDSTSKKEMTSACIEKMKQYFRINENGESKYTVGQVKSMLVKEGYPVGLVNSCLTKMLEDQHICY